MNNGQYQAISNGNSRATIDELGLTSKQIHEARQLRDAELQEPGFINKSIDGRLKGCELHVVADGCT